MFKLLKDGYCYSPEYLGKTDILIVSDKIYKIENYISQDKLWDVEIIDCRDKLIVPGLIDQHVHMLGGGGEAGPSSRIPELMFSDIITAGITTLVGVLGVDSVTRSISNLLAKANALQLEGVNTYIYTGSYAVPTATLTGRVVSDIVLIDKVIGVGEIAISDHRSSHPSSQALKELASEARVGGMLGTKAGIMHLHIGDGKEGLNPLFKITDESDFPLDMFVPTHLNRNKPLFEQAVEYCRRGGNIDITAGETSEIGYSVPDAIGVLIERGTNLEKVTVSSDGNGSIPARNGQDTSVGRVSQLFEDIRACVLDKNFDIGVVLKTVTSNVAKVLKLYPKKGSLSEGSDADILILDKDNFNIDTLMVGGEIFIRDSKVLRKGRYEN